MISGLAWTLFLVLILFFNARMKSTGGPGILSLEFAGTRHRALDIMSEWGDKGITAARWANVVDYGFIAAYVVYLTVAVDSARRVAVRSGRSTLTRVGSRVVVLPLIAGLADAVQNAALLLLLGRHLEGAAPGISLACGVVTATLSLVSLGYVAVVQIRRRQPDE